MTAIIPNYAGGVLCLTEYEGEKYLLLGKSSYKDKHGAYDLISAKRDATCDGTAYQAILEETLTAKFQQETLGVVSHDQQIYWAIDAACGRTTSLFRKLRSGESVEYKIYTITLITVAEDIVHRSKERACSCIPCRFSVLRSTIRGEHPIAALRWVRIDELRRLFTHGDKPLQNGLKVQDNFKEIVNLLNLTPAAAVDSNKQEAMLPGLIKRKMREDMVDEEARLF